MWDAVWIPAGEPHRLENNTAENDTYFGCGCVSEIKRAKR